MKEYILDHVLYEMEMFNYSYHEYYETTVLLKNASETDKHSIQMKWNMVYECLLMHTRNLIEFFENKSKPKDDIMIGTVLKNVKDYNLGDTADAHKFINKSVSHITQKRTKVQEIKTWSRQLGPVISAIVQCEKRFIEELAEEKNINEEIQKELAIDIIRKRIDNLQRALRTIEI